MVGLPSMVAASGRDFAAGAISSNDISQKIVSTFVFEAMPDDEALETLTLEERDGKTAVTTLTVHKTIKARDGHLASGRMEAGMTEGYERLDELLAALWAS